MVVSFSVNYLGVLVTSIASFIFGWLWYGPFFGKVWARENNISDEQGMAASKLFYHFLTTILLVYFFASLLGGTLAEGLMLALVIWLGFFLSTKLGSMIWMKQSWTLFFVDMLYHIINLVLIVWVLGFF